MEAVVGAVLVEEGEVLVGPLVVVVAEFVVDGLEILGVDLDAHLDAEVVLAIDVPRARVADHVAVGGLGEERALPERVRQRVEPERREERLAGADHLHGVVAVGFEERGEVVAGVGGAGGDDVEDVPPLLRPHVAEEVGRDGLVERHDLVPVLLVELGADVAVEILVERADLVPQPVELGGEFVGRHVVVRAPQRAGVLVAEFARALIHQLDEAGVVRAHRRGDRAPPGPRLLQRLGVVRVIDHVFELRETLARAAIFGAVLAAPVRALHPRRDLRQLLRLGRVARSGHRHARAEHVQLARDLGGESRGR